MEIVEVLEKMNSFLEQSFIFRSIKALLGFYVVVIVIVLLGVLFRIGKTYWVVLVAGQEFPSVTKGKFQKRWDRVQSLIMTEDSMNFKIAILESAQMLDEILKISQYSGDTLGDKLNGMIDVQLRNLEQVKEANKIKNKVVQDGGFDVSKEEARKIVEIFGDSLRFFEVID